MKQHAATNSSGGLIDYNKSIMSTVDRVINENNMKDSCQRGNYPRLDKTCLSLSPAQHLHLCSDLLTNVF